jgi:hypothetical protein
MRCYNTIAIQSQCVYIVSEIMTQVSKEDLGSLAEQINISADSWIAWDWLRVGRSRVRISIHRRGKMFLLSTSCRLILGPTRTPANGYGRLVHRE